MKLIKVKSGYKMVLTRSERDRLEVNLLYVDDYIVDWIDDRTIVITEIFYSKKKKRGKKFKNEYVRFPPGIGSVYEIKKIVTKNFSTEVYMNLEEEFQVRAENPISNNRFIGWE